MIIALVLVSAFLHALWNALLRLEEKKDRALTVAVVIATGFATALAMVRWQLGAVPFASLESVGFTLLAGTLEAAYFVTLAHAMELGRLGVVYTISRGGAVLAVWPLSIALFGELATVPAIAGTALVVGGLALSGLGGGPGARRSRGAGEAAHGNGRREALVWAVACAMSIAGYHLAYKAALSAGASPSACFALSLGVSAVINVARQGRGGGGDGGRGALMALVRRRAWRLALMGAMCCGSFAILLEALAIGGSGYVLTLRNTSVLFAVAMAWRIGERPARAEVAGAALVALGATLMAL